MNLIESGEMITQIVKKCITDEIKPEGLLSDVQTFIPSYRMDEPMDEPAVWLFEHPTIESNDNKGKGRLSSIIYLVTTFEFVCIVYDDELEEAEMKGKNLALRVGQALMKNILKGNNNRRVVNNIHFKSLYPTGEVQIENKTTQTPATSIVFDIEYVVDWLKCIR